MEASSNNEKITPFDRDLIRLNARLTAFHDQFAACVNDICKETSKRIQPKSGELKAVMEKAGLRVPAAALLLQVEASQVQRWLEDKETPPYWALRLLELETGLKIPLLAKDSKESNKS